jgi:nucleoprotein TPR
MERLQLQGFMDNVKNMHSELERANENDRRRLERQVQMLETQSQDLKKQLGEERENLRHITLQREIEVKELRANLDKNLEALSLTRESLAKAETSKTHLEERIESLSRQLQGNEEKLAVYERRGSTTGVSASAAAAASDMSREQQLEAELADIRAALKIAEVDLANARSNVAQFQDISKASETALEEFTAMHEEYKRATDAQIAQYEVRWLSFLWHSPRFNIHAVRPLCFRREPCQRSTRTRSG